MNNMSSNGNRKLLKIGLGVSRFWEQSLTVFGIIDGVEAIKRVISIQFSKSNFENWNSHNMKKKNPSH